MNKDSITILGLAKMMLRKWWLFLIVAVIFAAAAFFYTKLFVQPVYISSGTIYITNTNSANTQTNVNLSDVMLAQELVSTYSEILSSNTFLKTVSENSGLDYNYRQLKSMIAYSQKQGAPVMVVEAAAYDPKDACILAETILNSAQDEISRIIRGGVVSVIEHAEVPLLPALPNVTKNVFIAVVLAVLVVAVYVFCTEFFDDRLKNTQELSAYGLPVLAEIPYMLNEEEKNKVKNKKRRNNKENEQVKASL